MHCCIALGWMAIRQIGIDARYPFNMVLLGWDAYIKMRDAPWDRWYIEWQFLSDLTLLCLLLVLCVNSLADEEC